MRKSSIFGLAILTCVGGGLVARGAESGPATKEGKSPWRWLGPLAPHPDPMPPVPRLPQVPAHVWTMQEALQRALQANPDVQVALAGVQRQEGVRLQSVGLMLPTIAVSSSMSWREHSLIDRSAAEIANQANGQKLTYISTRSFDSRVEMRETVFDGFANWSQVKRAVMLKKKAAVDARDAYQKVAMQVRQAYDAILVRQAMLQTRRDSARDMKHLAEVAGKRYQAGEISEYESLRAESVQRLAEADLVQAEADLARSEETFCRTLYIARPPGGLQLAGRVEPVDYEEGFDSALSRAKANRLDLRSAKLQLDAAQMAVRGTAAAGYLPRVDAFINYGSQTSYYDPNQFLEGWTVGVIGNWNIFDIGRTSGALRAQRADRRVAEIRLAETERLVGADVHELFVSLDQTKSVLAAQVIARDLAERSVREARKLYEVGRVSLEQVLNAENDYRQAFLSWLGAVYSYNATVYQVDYSTGNDAFLDHVVAKP